MEIEELNKLLAAPDQYKEIWLQGKNGASLCALINGDIGWLMYLRSDEDAGFSSRNPHISTEENIEFYLKNGQQDFYPKNWTYHIDKLSEAMQSFLNDGNLPSQLEWHDDSDQNAS